MALNADSAFPDQLIWPLCLYRRKSPLSKGLWRSSLTKDLLCLHDRALACLHGRHGESLACEEALTHKRPDLSSDNFEGSFIFLKQSLCSLLIDLY